MSFLSLVSFHFLVFSSSSKTSIVLLWVFSKVQPWKRLGKWQCCVWCLFSLTDFPIKTTKSRKQKMLFQLLATQSSFVFWLLSSSYININKYFVGETKMSVFPRSNQVQFIPFSVIKACFWEKSKPIPRQLKINCHVIFNLEQPFQQCNPLRFVTVLHSWANRMKIHRRR